MVETGIILWGIECARPEQAYFFCFPSVSIKKIRNLKKYVRNRKLGKKIGKNIFLSFIFQKF